MMTGAGENQISSKVQMMENLSLLSAIFVDPIRALENL